MQMNVTWLHYFAKKRRFSRNFAEELVDARGGGLGRPEAVGTRLLKGRSIRISEIKDFTAGGGWQGDERMSMQNSDE